MKIVARLIISRKIITNFIFISNCYDRNYFRKVLSIFVTLCEYLEKEYFTVKLLDKYVNQFVELVVNWQIQINDYVCLLKINYKQIAYYVH